MNKNDRAKLEKILKLNEYQLHAYLIKYLNQKYKKPITSTVDYIVVEGDIPVCLVAHLDVVAATPPSDVFYDHEKEIMFCINGFGQDDRSGVFAILKLIEKGYRPHIIFTHGEEKGCIGSDELIRRFPCAPFDLKYLIQLDRRGEKDCVFYECDNEIFTKYVENFGFTTNFGSFTDISIIAPTWKIAAVNLSTGYYNEHSQNEYLHTRALVNTIEKVENMLKDIDNADYYQYIPSYFSYEGSDYSAFEDYCDFCYRHSPSSLLHKVICRDGYTGYVCDDCYHEKSLYCPHCKIDYEVTPYDTKCPYCDREGEEHVRLY